MIRLWARMSLGRMPSDVHDIVYTYIGFTYYLYTYMGVCVYVEINWFFVLVATMWRIHSCSMLILTLWDLLGPTGGVGGGGGTDGGSDSKHRVHPHFCRGQIPACTGALIKRLCSYTLLHCINVY